MRTHGTKTRTKFARHYSEPVKKQINAYVKRRELTLTWSRSKGSKRWPERGQSVVMQVNREEKFEVGVSPSSFKQAYIRRWQFEQESRTCRMTLSLSSESRVIMAKTIPKPEFTAKRNITQNDKNQAKVKVEEKAMCYLDSCLSFTKSIRRGYAQLLITACCRKVD